MSHDERGRLSPGERALWLLHKVSAGSAAFHLAGAVSVAEFDTAALRRALHRLGARHEALRTTYPADPAGEPVRRVGAAPRIEFVEAIGGDLESEAERPFDIASGPLLRVGIFSPAGGGRAILFVLHHLIADFGSLAVVLRELGALYGEETGGSPAELGPAPASYADWVESRARDLAGPRGDQMRAFWRERLAGPVPALALPADRPRPAIRSGAGHPCSVHLGGVETAGLLACARSRGATLFAVLLAACQLLLRRLSGGAEVWIGAPTLGRDAARWAGTLGYFVNPVVLRGAIPEGQQPFSALVDAARDEARGALAHRAWPLPWLAAEMQPFREAGRQPLFQAMLTVHRTRHAEEEALALLALGEGGGQARLGGLSFKTLPLRCRASQLDLSLAVAVVRGELRLRLEADADVFDATTAQRFSGYLATLLGAAAASPDRPCEDLSWLAAAERQQVVVEWGEGPPAQGGEETVLARIAALAVEDPKAPAVLRGGQVVLDRGGLIERAAHLAATLARLGAGPGQVVGLHLDRSPGLVEAVIAVLATGAAYLPLDPAYPRAYLAHALEDSGVCLVVTRRRFRASLPETRAGLVFLREGEAPAGGGSGVADLPAVDPDSLAYLLYTSGSSGRPKGVAVTHRNLASYLAWVLEEPLAGIDGLPFVTSLGFDASLKQVFAPLMAGLPVRVVDEETALRPERLLDHLRGPGRLALNCVPALWRSVLAAIESSRGLLVPPGLGRLLLGGEGFDRDLLDRTFRALPGLDVWNLYGPTEATANAAAARLDHGRPGVPPIGRPISGAWLQVVDRLGRTLPAGVSGELAIGGAGVARGYWRRPDLTAERFVPHPDAEEPGARLYRTGDLARWLPGGVLDLLGRIDRQVKIRGFRVEPAEVEAVLSRHPGVAACAVQPRGDAEDRLLVAWVVPAGSPAPAAADLLAWCRERLPLFLVPVAFVSLAALPRDPNGKLDRSALPKPDRVRSGEGFVAPRTPVERGVAALWAGILGLERVGAEDDFFDLGGHSLLATQVVSRIARDFGVEIGLRTFFEQPTVSAVAAAITRAQLQQVDPDRMAHLLARVRTMSTEELADVLREDAR